MATQDARMDAGSAILVGDRPDRLAAMETVLTANGLEVHRAADGAAALRAAGEHQPDYAFVDSDLPHTSAIKVTQSIKRRFPLALTAIFGAQIPADQKRDLINQGIDEYVELGSDAGGTSAGIRRMTIRKQIGIMGRNERILQAIAIVEGIACTKVTVLITGESGTGKELIARAVHLRSDRSKGPFIAVNCGALPQGILESELFGHEKGAFTGATSQRKGRFELADGGTLLLDEVGEMPPGTQVKLLRVLEEESFLRVGGSQDVKVDVRVIASTNRDLRHLVSEGHFRSDLYYRLNVVSINVPPLRERREDIRTIFFGAVEQARRRNRVDFGGITEEALAALERYDWPGNVRELRNTAESLLVLSGGRRIGVGDLPEHISGKERISRDLPVRVGRPRDEVERDLLFGRLAHIETQVSRLADVVTGLRDALSGSVPGGLRPHAVPADAVYTELPTDRDEIVIGPNTSLKDVERELIAKTLSDVGGNRKKAAKILGIGERTLYRRMKEFGLS